MNKKMNMTREEIVHEVFCGSREMQAHLLKPKNCDDRDLPLAVCGGRFRRCIDSHRMMKQASGGRWRD